MHPALVEPLFSFSFSFSFFFHQIFSGHVIKTLDLHQFGVIGVNCHFRQEFAGDLRHRISGPPLPRRSFAKLLT